MAAEAIRRHASSVARVLDVGMGAGQELLPFLDDAWCCGIDIAAESPHVARDRLIAAAGPSARLAVARASVEAIPFASGSIDVVICRLVLPYVNHALAIGELARVLRPGGILSVQAHGPRFYLARLRQAIAARDTREGRRALRALRSGVGFHITGKQRPMSGGGEMFVTVRMLTRLAERAALEVVEQIENRNPKAPHLLFRRR